MNDFDRDIICSIKILLFMDKKSEGSLKSIKYIINKLEQCWCKNIIHIYLFISLEIRICFMHVKFPIIKSRNYHLN